MITIIENKYEVEKDQWGWQLHSYHKPLKKNAKKDLIKTITYHGTWKQLIDKVLDSEIGTAEGDLRAVQQKLEQATKEIVERTEP